MFCLTSSRLMGSHAQVLLGQLTPARAITGRDKQRGGLVL